MLALKNSYISNIVVVVHFERDVGIRLEQANIEHLFKPIIGADSENLNVPDDAPPEIPRVFFRPSPTGFQMTVTQTSCQLDWRLTGKPGELLKQISEIQSVVREYQKALVEFKSPELFRECVFVLFVRCPDPRPLVNLSSEFASRYLNIKTDVPMNSGSFKAVFHIRDVLFMNIDADTYQVNSKSIDDGQFPAVSDSEVLESGVLVKVDVNTKLQMAKQGRFDFPGLNPLLSEAEGFLQKKFYDIFSE